jgi:autotransporter-associated beta strand protein
VSGGTFSQNDTGRRLMVGEEGNGTLNLSGSGLVRSAADYLPIGQGTTATGLINLDGGTLEVRRISGGDGGSTFNFNGGLLRAGANAQPDFMSGLGHAYVKASGARIDTSGNTITIAQALLDGSGGGGLTKTGNGTLYLNGVNTYVGATLVNAGTLGGNGAIAGPVTVAGGAGLAPGTSIGLLTVNNTLVLAGGSTTFMELNKTAGTNDSVQGVTSLTYGGTLVLKNLSGLLAVNDTFKLFAAGAYAGAFTNVISETLGQVVTWDLSSLRANGTVRVATAVAVPVSITSSTSGGVLSLGWPMDQTGWLLQAQTNSLAVGISTNWVTVPGSAATNQVSFPITSTNGSVFFRLLLP